VQFVYGFVIFFRGIESKSQKERIETMMNAMKTTVATLKAQYLQEVEKTTALVCLRFDYFRLSFLLPIV
jgi:hypothetical protein